jgi:hypothetical protein
MSINEDISSEMYFSVFYLIILTILDYSFIIRKDALFLNYSNEKRSDVSQ